MTPCQEKGYEVGQVFEVIDDSNFHSSVYIGDILVLISGDGTFEVLSGNHKGNLQWNSLFDNVTRIYPPEEKKPLETIDLLGHTWRVADLEAALKDVKPVDK